MSRRFKVLQRAVEGSQGASTGEAALRLQAELDRQILAGEPDPRSLEAVGQVVRQVGRQLLDADIARNLDLRLTGDYRLSHPANVFLLAVRIGFYLGYSQTDLVGLGTAALLHDIGNGLVDLSFLDTPEPLTPVQREIVATHVDLGADLLARQGQDEAVVAAVRGHHERQDGSGYPRGLAGQEIPQWASIIAVADTYDALLTDRLHRRRLPPALAYQLVVRDKGKLFDPEVIAAFQKHILPYPVGTRLRLSSGAIGTVVGVDVERPDKPVVDVDGQRVDLGTQRKLSVLQAILPRGHDRRPLRAAAVCHALADPAPGEVAPGKARLDRGLSCLLLDISRTGARLQGGPELESLGRRLLVEILGRDGSPLRIPAQVVWSRPSSDGCLVGIRFEELSAEIASSIANER